MTEPASDEVFSNVVKMKTVRLGIVLAKVNWLKVVDGDDGNVYLNGRTKENVAIRAGPEFGPELEGRSLIIYKTLYGFKSSSARFHEHLSVTLRKLGFSLSKADADLWIKKVNGH